MTRRAFSCVAQVYLARPHVRHSEWAEEDHLKSSALFCWWGRRTLPHDGSPSERSEGGGNNDTRPLRSTLRVRLRARLSGAASSPQTPSSAPDGRRAPLAQAATSFRRLQKVSSLPACGIDHTPHHGRCVDPVLGVNGTSTAKPSRARKNEWLHRCGRSQKNGPRGAWLHRFLVDHAVGKPGASGAAASRAARR